MPRAPHPYAPSEHTPLPVIQEDLEVHTETVSAGRVEVRVEQREDLACVDLEALSQHVDIERVPIGIEVERADGPRQEGDVLVVPVYEEVVVVQRRLVLKEEVRLHRRSELRQWQQEVLLRKDEPVIERHPPQRGPPDDGD